MNRAKSLRCRIRCLTALFIVGLILSGATAIPLRTEIKVLLHFFGRGPSEVTAWLYHVLYALDQTRAQNPFLFYGTDWLAFGHFVIALAFVGALRDPVRNRWLFDFGMMACVLVIPYAFVFGGFRGIPVWWRLVDCAFGVFGFIPLWFCRCWAIELERRLNPQPIQPHPAIH
jgi:hypothetical protein